MIRIFLKFIKNPVKFYRLSVLPRIYNNSPVLNRLKKNTQLQDQFIAKLTRYNTPWDETKKGTVLVQTVSDYEMCIKMAALAHNLAVKQNHNIGLYSAEYFVQPKSATAKYLSSARFRTNQDRIFLSFAGKVLYRNNDQYSDQQKVASVLKEIRAKLHTKADVINIHIEHIKIGDLVYDTYLRYANQPEVNLRDPFLYTLIEQAINIFFVSKDKLKQYHVSALVTSDTTYTYHGIAVRLCLANNIPVYSIGGYYSLVHKVLPEYPSHANNHFLFKTLFQQLPEQEKILETHKVLFEKRFEGVIDSATSYMKQSAFSADVNPELNGIDWKNTVVILAHCFFDSPHIYRDLLFPDFYDWITFTLNELIKQNITVIVKQHPNGTFQNDAIFESLKNKYTTVKFIDKKTSQLQIINSRPKAIITAYGTAAAEFAYQGFPVVTIYDNPFTAYDFTHLAKSEDEYRNLLRNVMTLPSKQHQKEIVEYYYMQYFFFLKGYPVDYLMCAKYKSDTSSDVFLEDYIPQMDEAYFKMVDAATETGLQCCAWEEANSDNASA